jgi:hypothetical protein
MVQSKEDIVFIIGKNGGKIRSFGIKRLGIFGSFVRNEQRYGSDVDLLAEFEQESKTFDNFIHACFFLEELLERPVELVTTESLSPYIKPYIMKEIEYVIIKF